MADSADILGIISRVQDLPSLPQVVNHVLDVMDDARSGAQDVARAMEEDPALTAKVLRISNSAYYSPRVEITSVGFAINRMGTREIRNIVISTGVVNAMKKNSGSRLDYTAFWRHCLTVAIAARVVNDYSPIAPKFSKKTENPYFVAGLLHDIGILILDQTLASVYADVLSHSARTGKPLYEVERRILGSDHEVVGEFICEKWHLPDLVAQTARYHHDPLEAREDHRIFIQVIHVADALCSTEGVAAFGDGAALESNSVIMANLGIDASSLEEIKAKILEAEQQSQTLQLLLT